MSTWPPSPLATSNQVLLLTDLRIVPLSCVPPQKRSPSAPGGTCAAMPIEVNCAIERFVRPFGFNTGAVGPTSPFRLIQVTALSGEVADGRPPRSLLYQTPPSLPTMTCLVLAGLKASAWKS